MITNAGDLLAAIGAHLAEFKLPTIASVHVASAMSRPQVTVQLSCRTQSAITEGLLAWADSLTEVSAEVWRVPQGDSVHLSVTGLLSGSAAVQVYGGSRVTDCGLGADLAPDATRTVPLAMLRHRATAGQATEEVIL